MSRIDNVQRALTNKEVLCLILDLPKDGRHSNAEIRNKAADFIHENFIVESDLEVAKATVVHLELEIAELKAKEKQEQKAFWVAQFNVANWSKAKDKAEWADAALTRYTERFDK